MADNGEPRLFKPGAAGMTVSDWADLVKIEVGPRNDTFTIPRFLACEKSQLLKRRFGGRRNKNKDIRLENEDAWIFTIYATFMYVGGLGFHDLDWTQPQDDPTGWNTLVRVYMLGTELEDRCFLELLDRLLNRLLEASPDQQLAGNFFAPPPDDVNLLFTEVPGREFIHRVFAGLWAARATRARFEAVQQSLHPDFKEELLREKLRTRDLDREAERERRARDVAEANALLGDHED